MHGGPTPIGIASPQFKDGKLSKYMYLPKMMTARVEQLSGDSIKNLEESIDIQKALESRLHEQFTEGVSIEKWRELKDVLATFNRLDADNQAPDPRTCLEGIQKIVAAGLTDAQSEAKLTEQLQSLHDTQRKLTESVFKCRKESQEIYTKEQWDMMLNILLMSVRNHSDGNALKHIVADLFAYQRDQEPKLIGNGVAGR